MNPDPDDDYDSERDVAGSLEEAYAAIRARVRTGGPPWIPRPWIPDRSEDEH